MNEINTDSNNYEEIKILHLKNNFLKDENKSPIKLKDNLLISDHDNLYTSEFDNNSIVKKNTFNLQKLPSFETENTTKNTNENLRRSVVNITTSYDINYEKNILKTNDTEKKVMPRIRKDFFGHEIKKGGRYKITFADDIYAYKHSADNYEEDNKNPEGFRSLSKVVRSRKKCITVKGKTLKEARQLKRIKSYNRENNRYLKHLVQIIDVESYKTYVKQNDYDYEEEGEGQLPDELEKDVVICCSGGCSIY